MKSRDDFIPEKTDKNLDPHQGGNSGRALILVQMKGKLTTKIAQHFARLAESAVGDSRQVARKTETIMKTTSVHLITVFALGCSALLYFVTGCSQAPAGPPKEVTVQADDKMRYDVTAFEVTPGQKVVVTFKNIGTTPKFSMGHNFVLLDRTINTGNIQSSFLDKASTEAAHDYVPPGAKEVLAHSKLLGPAETEVVTFNAPYIPGEYLYVCSFPGHYSQGTKGIMTVKQ
jgi:azurin